MQAIDYVCSECHERFETASSLLKHFALHVSLVQSYESLETSNSKQRKNCVPGLYPIKFRRISKSNSFSLKNSSENEDNVDSGFEDVNPLKYCQVAMAGKMHETNEFFDKNKKTNENGNSKRFVCIYCPKSFGWSTDLKRHILIHTGERPFKCDYCKFSFTRNFLLQKHKLKYHSNNEKYFSGTKIRMPLLKPLDISFKHKSRKQDKSNIKRKISSAKVTYQSKSKTYKFSQSVL